MTRPWAQETISWFHIHSTTSRRFQGMIQAITAYRNALLDLKLADSTLPLDQQHNQHLQINPL